jgi:hypothetical protein
VKNVAYVLALAAGVLTLSGCCDWFCKKPAKTEQAAESKALAENDVAAPATEEATPVAPTENVEAATTAPVEENATVAQAAAMPMNDVATEQKAA